MESSDFIPFRFVLSIVLICFAAGGLAGVSFGIYAVRMSKIALKWSKAKGKVVVSEMDEGHRWVGGQFFYNVVTEQFRPRVGYEYNVENKTYKGKRVRIAEFTFKDDGGVWANKVVVDYPKGKEVEVSYNPDRPKESVLEPGITTSVLRNINAGMIYFIIGACGLVARFLIHW
jgi:hypothetical protein